MPRLCRYKFLISAFKVGFDVEGGLFISSLVVYERSDMFSLPDINRYSER